MSISKWLRIKKVHNKKYFDIVKTGNPILDLVYLNKSSESLIEFVQNHGKDYLKITRGIRVIVQKLAALQNNLFELIDEYTKLHNENFKESYPLSKTDTATISESISIILKDQKTIFSDEALWKIAKNPDDKADFSDADLSDE